MKQVFFLSFILCLFSMTHTNGQILPDSLTKKLISLNEEEQALLLLNKSNELKSINGDQSLMMAKLAYSKATILNDLNLMAKSQLAIMNAHIVLANYDSVIMLSEPILANRGDYPENLILNIRKSLAQAYESQANYVKASEEVDEIIPYFKAKGDSTSVYTLSKLRANIYSKVGDFPNAIRCFQRSLRIAENEMDSAKVFLLYANIGNMYVKMQNFESSRNYLLKGLAFSQGHETDVNYKNLMSSLGSYYNRMHQHDSAEYYYKKGLEATLKLNKRDDIAGAYLNLGNLSCRLKKFEEGKAYFDTSLYLFRELNLKQNMAKVYDSYAVMFAVRQMYDSSSYYIKKELEIVEELGEAISIQRSLYLLAANYDKMGDYKTSLKYAKKYILFSDSIVGDKIQSKIADYEAKYETAKKERDIIKLQADQKAQKDKELILWISFSSFSVILLLIVWFIVQRRKKDKIIYQQEQLVLKKEKALADAELEKSKLQEEELKKEIQYKSKQLTTHALNMMQKNTLMQEIQEELDVLRTKAKTENKASFSRLKMLIKKNLRSEKDWDLFKLYFEDVNKDFYDNLSKISSELTSNDLKLCALLKLNMNIKESASVLNIEPASVKTARYKLRKKFNLNPEEDLVDFVRKVG